MKKAFKYALSKERAEFRLRFSIVVSTLVVVGQPSDRGASYSPTFWCPLRVAPIGLGCWTGQWGLFFVAYTPLIFVS
jgi:hypothetical protein